MAAQSLKVPGDFLAASEEYVSAEGTVEGANGIFAATVGNAVLDPSTHKASVQPVKAARPLRAGDLVYGLVQDVYDTVSLVEFAPEKVDGRTPGFDNRMAYVRISEVKQGYVEHFGDWLRIGDYVKARVLEVAKLGTYLTIKDAELGVVRAMCSRCKVDLVLNEGAGNCPQCGRTEQRKTPGMENRR